MDRLSVVIAVLALAGCKDEPAGDSNVGRTNGANVAAKRTDTAAFCDKKFDREHEPAFTTPELAGSLAPADGKWRWVNVWATWCKPCVEEIPRLVKWKPKLGAELALISIDENDADIADFRKMHPDTPPSARLANPDKTQGTWFGQLGLDAAAPIPVHIFVDPSNHVRCVRAGGVREQDYAMVEAILAGK